MHKETLLGHAISKMSLASNRARDMARARRRKAQRILRVQQLRGVLKKARRAGAQTFLCLKWGACSDMCTEVQEVTTVQISMRNFAGEDIRYVFLQEMCPGVSC